jgi:hypothetical protein
MSDERISYTSPEWAAYPASMPNVPRGTRMPESATLPAISPST